MSADTESEPSMAAVGASVNAEAPALPASWCHACGQKPVRGAFLQEDCELRCLECGKVGYIELEDGPQSGVSPPSDSALQHLSQNPAAPPSRSRAPTTNAALSSGIILSSPGGLSATEIPHLPNPFPFLPRPSSHRIVFNGSETRVVPADRPVFHTVSSIIPISLSGPPVGGTQAATSQAILFPPAGGGEAASAPQPQLISSTSMLELLGRLAGGNPALEELVQQMLSEIGPLSTSTGPPPASAAIVAALEDETLTAETAVGDCVICQEDFSIGDVVKRLSKDAAVCGHIFHRECVLPWLRVHNTCPICRYELPTDDPEYERRRREGTVPETGGGASSGSAGQSASAAGEPGVSEESGQLVPSAGEGAPSGSLLQRPTRVTRLIFHQQHEVSGIDANGNPCTTTTTTTTRTTLRNGFPLAIMRGDPGQAAARSSLPPLTRAQPITSEVNPSEGADAQPSQSDTTGATSALNFFL